MDACATTTDPRDVGGEPIGLDAVPEREGTGSSTRVDPRATAVVGQLHVTVGAQGLRLAGGRSGQVDDIGRGTARLGPAVLRCQHLGRLVELSGPTSGDARRCLPGLATVVAGELLEHAVSPGPDGEDTVLVDRLDTGHGARRALRRVPRLPPSPVTEMADPPSAHEPVAARHAVVPSREPKVTATGDGASVCARVPVDVEVAAALGVEVLEGRAVVVTATVGWATGASLPASRPGRRASTTSATSSARKATRAIVATLLRMPSPNVVSAALPATSYESAAPAAGSD